jgi:hypothetical protein
MSILYGIAASEVRSGAFRDLFAMTFEEPPQSRQESYSIGIGVAGHRSFPSFPRSLYAISLPPAMTGFRLFRAEDGQGLDLCCSARGEAACSRRDNRLEEWDSSESERVAGTHAVKQARGERPFATGILCRASSLQDSSMQFRTGGALISQMEPWGGILRRMRQMQRSSLTRNRTASHRACQAAQ